MARHRRRRGRTTGIPTGYAGVRFRSRLEARYAMWWDALGWSWVYEPVDCRGWVPDFAVYPPGAEAMLVECKPALDRSQLAQAEAQAERSLWRGRVAVVGVRPEVAEVAVLAGDARPAVWLPWPQVAPSGAWANLTWADCQNRTQWRPRR